MAEEQSEIDRDDINWYRSIVVAGAAMAAATGHFVMDPGVFSLLVMGGMAVGFVMLVKLVEPEAEVEANV